MRALALFCAVFLLTVSAARAWETAGDEESGSLEQRVLDLSDKGRFAEALPLAEELRRKNAETFGHANPETATALFILGNVHANLSNYQEAKDLHARALRLREEALGPRHPDVAASLDRLGMAEYRLGNLRQARETLEKTLVLREAILGPDHPDVASSLSNLALVLGALGEYGKAAPLHARAIAINEKSLGEGHPNFGASVANLAALYAGTGQISKAVDLYARALAIREKALGPGHPDVAATLNNLAALHHQAGEYTLAESLYRRALVITEKALGTDSPMVATALSNLGLLYGRLGEYDKAEPLHERALTIRARSLGPEHPQTAHALNNLGTLYMRLGDRERAEPLFLQALSVWERQVGSGHPDIATVLTNLGSLYLEQGRPEKAAPLFTRAMEIREAVLGPGHPDLAAGHGNLGSLYFGEGKHALARSEFEKALALSGQALGREHPDTALARNNLATLLHAMGDYKGALAQYETAVATLKTTLGGGHPSVATVLSNLAALFAAMGDNQAALDAYMEVQGIDGETIDQVLGFSHETRKAAFIAQNRDNLMSLLSLVVTRMGNDSGAARSAFQAWLSRKGLPFEAWDQSQAVLAARGGPGAFPVWGKLTRAREELSRLVFAGHDARGLDVYRRETARLEREKERLEAELSRLSRAWAEEKNPARANPGSVAAALPKNAALLECARVPVHDFSATGDKPLWLPARYLAFVLHGGGKERVELVDLGPAERADKAVYRLKEACGRGGTRDPDTVRALAREAWDAILAPVWPAVKDKARLFISPDGRLNLLPFEILAGPDGKHLIESHSVVYLSSGADLADFGAKDPPLGPAVLMGDPDYDLGEEGLAAALAEMGLSGKAAVRAGEGEMFVFRRLPETAREVLSIAEVLGPGNARVYLGAHAAEEVLTSLKRPPGMLHLATHGFFLSDRRGGGNGDGEGTRGILPLPKKAPAPPSVGNPLLRSGVALAGANRAVNSGDVSRGHGLVTAEEILGLPLSGTRLVTLSACETGLGAVLTGQGVFGLRSAFRKAGARSMVMSMWEVPDVETRELMVDFYKNMQAGKMDRCEALRNAALREMRMAEERYGFAHPAYWGGFVFIGEP
jgi:tetratricopeptide (TPR) repeat protein